MRFGNFHMRSVVVSFHLMSTPALALTVPRVPRRLRRRRHALNRFPVQWHGAAVAEAVALTGGKSPKRYLVLVLAAVAVLGAHALWQQRLDSYRLPAQEVDSRTRIRAATQTSAQSRAATTAAENSPQGATTDPDCRSRSE